MFQRRLTSVFITSLQLSFVLFLLLQSERNMHATFPVTNATVRSGEASWKPWDGCAHVSRIHTVLPFKKEKGEMLRAKSHDYT